MKRETLRQAITAYLGRLGTNDPGWIGDIADIIRGEPMPPGTNGRQEPVWKAVFDELWAMDADGLVKWSHVGGWRLRG